MRRVLGFILAALFLAACEPDPVAIDTPDPDPDPPDTPSLRIADTLMVLGQGTVTERYTAEVAAHGQWVYTTTWGNRTGVPGNAVKIWRVSGYVPTLADSLIIENVATIGDVQISDDGALLVVATERIDGSIIIFDRKNPERPVRLARHMSQSTKATGVHTVKLGRVDGRHYAFLSVNPGGTPSTPPRLVVVDITDPAAPEEVGVHPMGTPYVHDVFVRDGVLFTALWHEGLSIWDIGGAGKGGTPASPVLLGNVRTVDGSAHNVWWHHALDGSKRYAFVGEEGPGSIGATSSGDIHVVDLSDLSNPREVAFYHVPGAGAHNFVMDERNGVLYAAFYNGGVRALEVNGDLSACTPAQRAPDGRCDLKLMGREAAVGLQNRGQVSIWGVAMVADALYASDMLNGLWVLDATVVPPW